jgi:hypothetical protein
MPTDHTGINKPKPDAHESGKLNVGHDLMSEIYASFDEHLLTFIYTSYCGTAVMNMQFYLHKNDLWIEF